MIRVEKVLSKRELKEFIAFPSQLFRDDPNWIEPLHVEREEHLSKKNPGTDHIEWQAWVAKNRAKSLGASRRKSMLCTGSCMARIPAISA